MNFDTPIFICGYPKSGTTLLVSLLEGHSRLIVIPEETKFFSKVLKRKENRFDFLFTHTNLAVMARGLVDEPSGIRDYTGLDFERFRRTARRYWEQSDRHDRRLLEAVACALAAVVGSETARFWVEKTPKNEFYLQRIHRWWPKAKPLLILRDPRQCFSSHREYQKKKRHPSRVIIEDFIARWKQSVRCFERHMQKTGQGRIIRYEDLVARPETVMRRVSAFLDIEFERGMLQPTRFGGSWEGNSSQGIAYEGIKKVPSNYLQYLSEREVRMIEANLGPLMETYGYEPSGRAGFSHRLAYRLLRVKKTPRALNKLLIHTKATARRFLD